MTARTLRQLSADDVVALGAAKQGPTHCRRVGVNRSPKKLLNRVGSTHPKSSRPVQACTGLVCSPNGTSSLSWCSGIKHVVAPFINSPALTRWGFAFLRRNLGFPIPLPSLQFGFFNSHLASDEVLHFIN
jgi:hypothetical protein